MKNFSLKTRESSRHNSKRVIGQAILLAVSVFVVIHFFGSFVGTVVSVFTTPVYAVRSWMSESTATIPSYFRSRTELLDEIKSQNEKIATQSGNDATINRMQAENAELRGLLNSTDDERIVAGVIARPPFLPYDALLIDRGSHDGVKEHAIVYFAHDRTIGFVSRVFKQSALITLFSTPGIESTVYVIGPNLFTNAYGEGGGVIRVSVPQGLAFAVGDVVVMPSMSVGILGLISTIESVATQPEQHGYVTFDVPIQSIRSVGVSTRTIQEISFAEAEEVIRTSDYGSLVFDVPDEYRVHQHASTSASTTDVVSSTSTRVHDI